MPRLSDHFVKSSIRLVRQSTQVPNTSNTSAFTAETSDMSAPCVCCRYSGAMRSIEPGISRFSGAQLRTIVRPLRVRPGMTVTFSKHLAVLDEPEIVRNPIIESPGLRVARLRKPIDAARVRRPGSVVNGFDQCTSKPSAARGLCDKQIFQIAVSLGSPGRTMKEVMGETRQVSIDVAAERKHRFIRIVKSAPREIAHVPRQRRLVEGEIARPQRIPGFALVFTNRPYQDSTGHFLLNRGG